MEKHVGSLREALNIKEREHIALVGGGGKTSLMFALADECRRGNKRVVTSTTTKIRHRESERSPCTILIESGAALEERIREALQTFQHVFVARSLLKSGKMEGISPTLAGELFQGGMMDYLIIEADGAAGSPVKAPAEHEPVIPGSVTKVVALLGLEALGNPIGSKLVFRVDLFKKLTKTKSGDKITPDILSRLFLNSEGLFKGAPQSAEKIAFLNKHDLLSDDRDAKVLAGLILEKGSRRVHHVVFGSIRQKKYVIMGRENERNI